MNFFRVNILFAFLWIGASYLVGQDVLPWWVLFILVLIYIIWVVYGSVTIHSNFFMDVVCAMDKPKKLALTFDDGPHPDLTPKMLDLLDQKGIKATFFCIGNRVEKHPEIVKEIAERGHIVANHTMSHPLYWGMMPGFMVRSQMEECAQQIEAATGKRPNFFRPPFGVINPIVRQAIRQLGVETIGWNLRSRDGGPLNRDQIYKMVRPNLEQGSIMLFHDTNAETYHALDRILDDCQQLGLEIVPLDQLIEKPAYV